LRICSQKSPSIVVVVGGRGVAQAFLRGLAREGEHDLDQRDAVGVAVVDAGDDRARAADLDHVELPERAREVERGGGEPAHEVLELGLSRLAREARALHVEVDVELGVLLPPRARGVLDGAAPEPAVGEEARSDGAPHLLEVGRALEHHDAHDHHEVRGLLHPQPRGVDAGDAITNSHWALGARSSFGAEASWGIMTKVFP
jgi:hypothetical protein